MSTTRKGKGARPVRAWAKYSDGAILVSTVIRDRRHIRWDRSELPYFKPVVIFDPRHYTVVPKPTPRRVPTTTKKRKGRR